MTEQFLISTELEDGEENRKTLLTSKALRLTIIREVCLEIIENELKQIAISRDGYILANQPTIDKMLESCVSDAGTDYTCHNMFHVLACPRMKFYVFNNMELILHSF